MSDAEAISTPFEPGGFVGDIYFGHPLKSTMGTHRWSGSEWVALPSVVEALAALLAAAKAERDRLREACSGLRSIVEGIDGAMKHGTWRDENGTRLKDTPEWVRFYNATTAALKGESHD